MRIVFPGVRVGTPSSFYRAAILSKPSPSARRLRRGSRFMSVSRRISAWRDGKTPVSWPDMYLDATRANRCLRRTLVRWSQRGAVDNPLLNSLSLLVFARCRALRQSQASGFPWCVHSLQSHRSLAANTLALQPGCIGSDRLRQFAPGALVRHAPETCFRYSCSRCEVLH